MLSFIKNIIGKLGRDFGSIIMEELIYYSTNTNCTLLVKLEKKKKDI